MRSYPPDGPAPLPLLPPTGPITVLAGWEALAGWAAPRAGRLRRAGRWPHLLRLRATATGAPATGGASPDAATTALLLDACGHRLRARVRATDALARIGHAGFAVLLDSATTAGAQAAAARLVAMCQGPYRIGERRFALCLEADLERPLRAV